MGAMASGGSLVLDQDVIDTSEMSQQEFERAVRYRAGTALVHSWVRGCGTEVLANLALI